jgi:hypothetical protein
MAEFSLGAAIGATGKFPKYIAPKPQETTSPEQEQELARLRQMVAADKTKYHNMYANDVKNKTAQFFSSFFDMKRNRDPNIVEKTYSNWNDWNTDTQVILNKSNRLFGIEKFATQGSAQGKYVPNSISKFGELIRNSRSEDEFMQKIQKNPEVFFDGYITVDQNTGEINYEEQDVIDFGKYLKDNVLTKNKAVLETISSKDIGPNQKQRLEIRTIPTNAEEAEATKQFLIKNGASADIKVDNAYDLGKSWFDSNKDVRTQYRSRKYEAGNADILNKTPAQLYDEFYKDYVLPNIPAYDKLTEAYTGPRTVVSVSTGQEGGAATYQVQEKKTINYIKGQSESIASALLSKTSQGNSVNRSKDPFIIDMRTGKPAYRSGDTGTVDYSVSTLHILPTAFDTSGNMTPLTTSDEATARAAGVKIRYVPWVEATTKSLNIGTVPTVGVETHLIPAFEPKNENGKLRIRIPKNERGIVSGSTILGSLLNQQNLKGAEYNSWMDAYRKVMQKVQDDTDLGL